MITEDFVSFETAKLLKEKGFDGPCYKVWKSHGESSSLVWTSCFVEGETVVNRESVDNAAKLYAYEYNLNDTVDGYLAPTLQMTMKWLRELYNLQIQIAPITSKHKDWAFGIYRDFSPLAIDLLCFPTYEEACEAGIKYCLENLI